MPFDAPRELTDPKAMRALAHPVRLSLLELLHEHDRLRERVEASERENERLRGVTYENEQLRNRLETSERQAEHLRQSLSELRGENERHQKQRDDAAERLNHLVNEIAQRLRPGGMARS